MPRDLAFPKSRRLTRAAEFERVRNQGTVTRGQLLSLAVLTANAGGQSRAGFITSRKVGGAVARNRVRRRLREIFRHHQHEIVGGAWIITIASSRATHASYLTLEHEWLRLAKRASILAS